MLAGPPYAFTTRVTNDVATCNLNSMMVLPPATCLWSFILFMVPFNHVAGKLIVAITIVVLIVLLVYLGFSPWSLTCQVLCILFSTSCFSYY
jgi:hypothetical protein